MEFKREDRYLVLKRKDLVILSPAQQTRLFELVDKVRRLRGPELQCVVVESDWPEYEDVWDAIERRMTGRETFYDEEIGRWQDAIRNAVIEGSGAPDMVIDGGCDDGADALEFCCTEISQGFGYIDNRCYETFQYADALHEMKEGESSLDAVLRRLKELRAENEELAQRSCDECDPENYGWVFNRVEGRGACTCIIEAEPFQILLKALERLAAGDHGGSFYQVEEIAKEALRSVLPLEYSTIKSEV